MIGLGSDKNRARWVFVYLYSADTSPEIRTGKILSKSERAKQKPVLTRWLSKKKALLLLNRRVHTLPAYCSQSPWRSHILPLLLEHVATVREPRRVRTTATFCEKMQRLRDKGYATTLPTGSAAAHFGCEWMQSTTAAEVIEVGNFGIVDDRRGESTAHTM